MSAVPPHLIITTISLTLKTTLFLSTLALSLYPYSNGSLYALIRQISGGPIIGHRGIGEPIDLLTGGTNLEGHCTATPGAS